MWPSPWAKHIKGELGPQGDRHFLTPRARIPVRPTSGRPAPVNIEIGAWLLVLPDLEGGKHEDSAQQLEQHRIGDKSEQSAADKAAND